MMMIVGMLNDYAALRMLIAADLHCICLMGSTHCLMDVSASVQSHYFC